MRNRVCFAVLAWVFVTVPMSHAAWRAGLLGGVISGGAFNTTGYPSVTNTYLCPHVATNYIGSTSASTELWKSYVTWVYTGQIYLDGSTYWFAEGIDDAAYLKIGGKVLINDATWNNVAKASITTNAGWYGFELRMFNGGGAAGPFGNEGIHDCIGFGYVKGGSTAPANADFVFPSDPGDRSLFRYDDGRGFNDVLTVKGVPDDYGEASPDYGDLGAIATGSNFICSVSASFSNANVRGICMGYNVATNDGEALEEAWGAYMSGTGNTLAYSHPGLMARLAWNFGCEYLVSVTPVYGGSCSVTSQWYEADASVSITATPSEGFAFTRWSGDVPASIADVTQSSISFACDRPYALVPVFNAAYYVATWGDNDDLGISSNTAFRNIEHALAVASNGDTVYVLPGDYAVTITLVVDKGIRLSGAGRGTTAIARTGANNVHVLTIDNADAVVSGFTISNGLDKTVSYGTGGVLIGAAGGTLADCRVAFNYQQHGYGSSAGVKVESAAGKISRCIIDNNRCTSNSGSLGGGVYINNGTMENCLVYGNYCLRSGAGVYALNSAVIRNCTIAGNSAGYFSAYGSCGGVTINSSSVRIFNTVIRDNVCPNQGGATAPNVSGQSAYDSIFVNCAIPVPLGINCVTNDALFADAAAGDYSIMGGSPLIDAGAAVGETKDITGEARSVGTVDIGCYEARISGFKAAARIEKTRLLEGDSARLAAHLFNAPAGAPSYDWTITKPSGGSATYNVANPAFAVTEPGYYGIALAASVGGDYAPVYTHANAFYVSPDRIYVSKSETAAHKFPFASEADATDSIADALEAACDGATILIGDGTYDVTSTIVVEKGVTLIATNGHEKTTLKANLDKTSITPLVVNHAGAVVKGFSVTGGRPTYTAAIGGGVLIGAQGGRIEGMRIHGNKNAGYDPRGAGLGMNSSAAFATHCIISNNTIDSIYYSYGGGVAIFGGTLQNSLIVNNVNTRSSSMSVGGGVYASGSACRLVNCTVAANLSANEGGGIYRVGTLAAGPQIINCITFGNTSTSSSFRGAPDWYCENNDATNAYINCAVGTATPPNATCLAVDPLFTDAANGDYTLMTGSALRDKGAEVEGQDGTDLAGGQRKSGDAVDIGCYEIDQSQISIGFSAQPAAIFVGESTALVPVIFGVSAEATHGWILRDQAGNEMALSEDVEDGMVFNVPALYDITLIVTNVTGEGTQVLTNTLQKCLLVAPLTNYVDNVSVSPVAPYATPATAATNLEDAVAWTLAGSTVLMSDGDYPTAAKIILDKELRITSRNGASRTRVYGQPSKTHAVFLLNDPQAFISGITISDGLMEAPGQIGGGVCIGGKGGVVEDCVITNNIATGYEYFGGGVGISSSAGRMSRCVIAYNQNTGFYSPGSGVAISAGILENCLVYSNRSTHTSGDRGCGGVRLSGSGVVRNCTIYGNYCGTLAGGIRQYGSAMVINTAIFDNLAPNDTSSAGAPDWRADNANCFSNCAVKVEAGYNCVVTNNPMFKNAGALDFALQKTSPLRDRGLNMPWMENATDLAGKLRIDHKQVDIGCYEVEWIPAGTIFLFR